MSRREKSIPGNLMPAQSTQELDPEVERVKLDPVVKERIQRKEITVIQPVIQRERFKTEIHQITQPYKERVILPPIEEQGETLTTQTLEKWKEEGGELSESAETKVVSETVEKETITKKPILHEQQVMHSYLREEELEELSYKHPPHSKRV